jgi:hypothetical protein
MVGPPARATSEERRSNSKYLVMPSFTRLLLLRQASPDCSTPKGDIATWGVNPQPWFLLLAKTKGGAILNLASTHINGGVMVKTRYAKQSESEGRSSPFKKRDAEWNVACCVFAFSKNTRCRVSPPLHSFGSLRYLIYCGATFILNKVAEQA